MEIITMGLFGKPKNEREELQKKISKLMDQYDKEKIDGATYMEKMLKLTQSHQKKKK